ncbi:MAG: biotin-dependent carboxyltransferase family protein [Candidatus Limnocylindria bacterium]
MIVVLEPGALTSVQTAGGRPGWRHLGVPVGGAVDPWSARLANRLVGNPDDAALIEVTHFGPTLRFEAAADVAIVGGAFTATLNGLPVPRATGRHVRPGATLRIGTGSGARCYVALSGGIQVAPVLGSAATDLRSGFGGHDGRALRAGDRLAIGGIAGVLRRGRDESPSATIRIVPGPHGEATQLVGAAWTVSGMADRTGARLEGEPIRLEPSEVQSMALPAGAIQVPPDGLPIVMLADRPVTGGYPVPACVIGADLGAAAQLRPGDEVQFELISIDLARQLLVDREELLAATEDLDGLTGDEPGWAGALE